MNGDYKGVDVGDFLSMKRYMDQWLKVDESGAQPANSSLEWVLRKQTEHVKVWTRWTGTDWAPHLPILRAYHYFPNVDDPRVVKAAMYDFKAEWDR